MEDYMHDSQDDGNDNCKDDSKDKIFTRLEKKRNISVIFDRVKDLTNEGWLNFRRVYYTTRRAP